jgi:hypothetical protein
MFPTGDPCSANWFKYSMMVDGNTSATVSGGLGVISLTNLGTVAGAVPISVVLSPGHHG